MTVSSSRINHTPRINKNRDNSGTDLRLRARKAPVPVSRKNVGAQMWVIQRVRNSGTVVCARLVGLTPGTPKKSRT